MSTDSAMQNADALDPEYFRIVLDQIKTSYESSSFTFVQHVPFTQIAATGDLDDELDLSKRLIESIAMDIAEAKVASILGPIKRDTSAQQELLDQTTSLRHDLACQNPPKKTKKHKPNLVFQSEYRRRDLSPEIAAMFASLVVPARKTLNGPNEEIMIDPETQNRLGSILQRLLDSAISAPETLRSGFQSNLQSGFVYLARGTRFETRGPLEKREDNLQELRTFLLSQQCPEPLVELLTWLTRWALSIGEFYGDPSGAIRALWDRTITMLTGAQTPAELNMWIIGTISTLITFLVLLIAMSVIVTAGNKLITRRSNNRRNKMIEAAVSDPSLNLTQNDNVMSSNEFRRHQNQLLSSMSRVLANPTDTRLLRRAMEPTLQSSVQAVGSDRELFDASRQFLFPLPEPASEAPFDLMPLRSNLILAYMILLGASWAYSEYTDIPYYQQVLSTERGSTMLITSADLASRLSSVSGNPYPGYVGQMLARLAVGWSQIRVQLHQENRTQNRVVLAGLFTAAIRYWYRQQQLENKQLIQNKESDADIKGKDLQRKLDYNVEVLKQLPALIKAAAEAKKTLLQLELRNNTPVSENTPAFDAMVRQSRTALQEAQIKVEEQGAVAELLLREQVRKDNESLTVRKSNTRYTRVQTDSALHYIRAETLIRLVEQLDNDTRKALINNIVASLIELSLSQKQLLLTSEGENVQPFRSPSPFARQEDPSSLQRFFVTPPSVALPFVSSSVPTPFQLPSQMFPDISTRRNDAQDEDDQQVEDADDEKSAPVQSAARSSYRSNTFASNRSQQNTPQTAQVKRERQSRPTTDPDYEIDENDE